MTAISAWEAKWRCLTLATHCVVGGFTARNWKKVILYKSQPELTHSCSNISCSSTTNHHHYHHCRHCLHLRKRRNPLQHVYHPDFPNSPDMWAHQLVLPQLANHMADKMCEEVTSTIIDVSLNESGYNCFWRLFDVWKRSFMRNKISNGQPSDSLIKYKAEIITRGVFYNIMFRQFNFQPNMQSQKWHKFDTKTWWLLLNVDNFWPILLQWRKFENTKNN